MKSVIVFTLALIASTSAFAAPTQGQVNQKALEILIANSASLHVVGAGSGSLSTLLAKELTGTTNISNSCKWDSGDDVYKCGLTILNKDKDFATMIQYQIQTDSAGMPSLLEYSEVQVTTAG